MKLRIFDFDDSLVKTKSFIYVTHADGTKSTLTPAEYAIYEKQPGDVFDYSDFEKLNHPASIIKFNRIFHRIVNKGGKRKIAILTARANPQPVRDFLKMSGVSLSKVEIVALGDSNPMKKAEWIERQIKLGYNDVAFFDDSPKNIRAINTLKSKYKTAKIKAQLVKEDMNTIEEATMPTGAKRVSDVTDFFRLAKKHTRGKNDIEIKSKGNVSMLMRGKEVIGAFDTKTDSGWVLEESIETIHEEYEEIDAYDVLDEISEKAEDLMDYVEDMNPMQVAMLQEAYDDMCLLYDVVAGVSGREKEDYGYDIDPEIHENLEDDLETVEEETQKSSFMSFSDFLEEKYKKKMKEEDEDDDDDDEDDDDENEDSDEEENED